MRNGNHVSTLHFGLVKLIKITHLCVDNFSQPVIKRGSLLEFFYTDLKQFRNESLADFRTRIELVADSFDTAGLADKKPDDEELAWLFIKKLNENKYPAIAEDTQYNINMEVIKSPRNLDEAVEYVQKWERSNKAYAYQANKMQQHSNATMFATGARNGGRGRGGQKGGNNNKNDGQGNKTKLTPEEKAEKLKTIECYSFHKKGHYSSKCPQNKKKENDDSSQQGGDAQNYVTLINEDVDSMLFVTTVENQALVATAIGNKKLRDDEILLDNEAQVSVFRSPSIGVQKQQAVEKYQNIAR